MTRDMDLVRTLLLRVEDLHIPPGAVMSFPWSDELFVIEGKDHDAVIYNFDLLVQAVFIATSARKAVRAFVFMGLTWDGHEFLESIRNPEVWTRTKAGMKKVGGVSFDLAIQIAKPEGKRLITEHLGIPLP